MPPVEYRISHTTEYRYQDATGLSYNVGCMRPRNGNFQHCLRSSLTMEPAADYASEYRDMFGNRWDFLSFEKSFTTLAIEFEHRVQVTSPWRDYPGFIAAVESNPAIPMEDMQAFRTSEERSTTGSPVFGTPDIGGYEMPIDVYRGDSAFIAPSSAYTVQAEQLLSDFASSNANDFAKAYALCMGIYRSFEYKPQSTDIFTPVEEVARTRCGVCQDYAHYNIALLRAIGIPARYVSGYLYVPRDESAQRRGADASHAWLSAYVHPLGWVDFDPTNGCLITDQHICIAWGRDYSDVTPLRGVVFGGGAQQLSVAVDVQKHVPAKTG